MKLKIAITMDNDAFEPCNGDEASRILLRLAHEIDGCDLSAGFSGSLLDINGNSVGEVKVAR